MLDSKTKINNLRSFKKGLLVYLNEGGSGDTEFNKRIRHASEKIEKVLVNADNKANTNDDWKCINAFNSDYDLSIGVDKVVQMYVSDLKLVTPKDIENDTPVVSVETAVGIRLGYDNIHSNLANDIDVFKQKYPGKNIKDYVMIYIPGFGYDFYQRIKVNNKKVFVLGRNKRHELLMLLSGLKNKNGMADLELFDKFATVFMKKPICSEYYLSLYNQNKGFCESCYSWFNDQVRLLYGNTH